MPRRISTRGRSAGTNPSNVTLPSISGTVAQGQVLTCNPGFWAGLFPLTFSYQWVRGASTNVGTNSPQYTPVIGDATFTLKCQVTVSNALGGATATSPSTIAVP